MRSPKRIFLAAMILGAGVAAAHADDWNAVRLRGTVLELVNGAWQPVHRNGVVPDETVIRTLANGYVDFTRGAETVSMSPDTQIRILDKGGAKPFTTVEQSFGTVAVEAEVKNVQHFAVQTPYLAAVVKGTRFTVTADGKGASVSVQRGHVEVDGKANKTHVTISIGQSARTGSSTGGNLVVSGNGELPVVLSANGLPVSGADLQATAAELAAAAKAAEELAKELKTPEAKAAADAAKKAADAAKKAADNAAKQARDDAKKADDAAKKAQQQADKAAKDGGKPPPPPKPAPPPPPPKPKDDGKKGKG